MNIEAAIEKAIELAKIGAVVYPPLANGAKLAESTLEVLNGLHTSAPDHESMDDLEEAHKALYKAMTDKGHMLSARLRG